MRQPSRFVRDNTGGYKIAVSLPGGRYQLSLDDRAIAVLQDQLELSIRDTVPEHFVRFFVAMGDAWFPSAHDTEDIIAELPAGDSLTATQRQVLAEYLTESRIPARNEQQVRTVLASSPIAEEISDSELMIQDLPEIPDWVDLSGSRDRDTPGDGETSAWGDSIDTTPSGETPQRIGDNTVETQSDGEDETHTSPAESASDTEPGVSQPSEETITELREINGVGEVRARALVEAGVRSVAELADARPVDLAGIEGINEELATVAIEGARELIGTEPPAAERLAAQTGRDPEVFEPVLSSLAASGIPASEAGRALRLLYGPTIADLDGVTGEQAYHLWEAGYQTPQDLIEASESELLSVYSVGEATVTKIKESAASLTG